jgi:cytochrome P450
MNIIKGSKAVREAARDYQRYSSDLQGDQDVRDYKQLPLEVDPPHHTILRSLLMPWFSKDAMPKYEPEFRVIAEEIISEIKSKGEAEITRELGLLMVVRCLGVVFGRPQDIEEWFSWGPDTWITDDEGIRHGEHLDRYLAKTFDELDQSPTDDLFGVVNRAEVDGIPLTRKEKYGIANLVLAGGRDTVVKLMTGSLWHLAGHADHCKALSDRPELIPNFIQEMVRFLSPLPMMHRVDVEKTVDVTKPEYAYLSFISANQDTSAFETPEQIKLDRPNNQHLGFGYGRHSCIGKDLAQLEAKVILETWLRSFDSWEIKEDSEIFFDYEEYPFIPSRFHSVKVTNLISQDTP